MNQKNYNLERFIEAQQPDYETALSEIKNGKKRSHWMWYIFPQILGLGFTSTSMHFGIRDIDEATAYLNNEILSKRLIEISGVLLMLETNDAEKIFGRTDSMKLKSSMTLFATTKNANPVFQSVLDKFFKGMKDERTFELLDAAHN